MSIMVRDLSVDKGVDWPNVTDLCVLTWRTGARDQVTDLPPLVDMTGWTALLVIRASPVSVTALLTLADGAGITLGGTAGTVTLAMTGTQTATLPVGTLAYDLVLTDSLGGTIKFMRGSVRVRATSAVVEEAP